jgi:hypothetical protein
MYANLAPDFSHEEMREMPPETAKKMIQVSSARRQDPAIREASKKKRKEFVRTVKAIAPEQLESGCIAIWRSPRSRKPAP